MLTTCSFMKSKLQIRITYQFNLSHIRWKWIKYIIWLQKLIKVSFKICYRFYASFTLTETLGKDRLTAGPKKTVMQ